MLARLGNWLYSARVAVLLVTLLLVAAASVYGFGIFGALKGGGFTVPTSDSARATDLVTTQLSTSTTDVVILLRSDTASVTDPTVTSAATAMLDALKARPEVAAVTSYYSTNSANFISRDQHETYALVRFVASDQTAKLNAFDAVKPLLAAPPLQVTLGGSLLVNRQINQQIGSDIEHAEIITMPIVLVLSFIIFGGLVAAGLPLLIGGIAIAGAFALLRLLTNVTDVSIFAANVITLVGLGLAIDYSLFIVTRFREELALRGGTNDAVKPALSRTLATAGRTVLFSGLTVSTSLLGLLFFPEYFLRSMGLGTICAVIVAMLSALIFLPAVLALLGTHINALSGRALLRRGPAHTTNDAHGVWYRLSQTVMRFPIPIAVGVIALLLLVGSPFTRVAFGSIDVRVLPTSQSARVVVDRLSTDFVQQGGASATLVVTTTGDAFAPTNLAALSAYVQRIDALPGVIDASSIVSLAPNITLDQYQQLYANPAAAAGTPIASIVTRAQSITKGSVTRIDLTLHDAENSTATTALIKQIRSLSVPAGLTVLVDGQTASQIDLVANLSAVIPLALGVIAIAIFILLFLMTGSLIVPLKAIVLNLLSLTATFGSLVWIFQEGHLQNVLGFQSTGTLETTQPVLIFAIAFGLSMDYEVFLLSRIKEEFDRTGDNREAIASGLQRTGGLITSAALLLAVVVGAFATSQIVFIKMVGVGLAIAVIMDATIVRTFLVPATMRLLGNLNWWAPRPLQTLWERIGLRENDDAPQAALPTPSVNHAE